MVVGGTARRGSAAAVRLSVRERSSSRDPSRGSGGQGGARWIVARLIIVGGHCGSSVHRLFRPRDPDRLHDASLDLPGARGARPRPRDRPQAGRAAPAVVPQRRPPRRRGERPPPLAEHATTGHRIATTPRLNAPIARARDGGGYSDALANAPPPPAPRVGALSLMAHDLSS